MVFYSQTLIPATNDYMLVGYLENPVRDGLRAVGKPWANASTIVRRRVYSKGSSRSQFVDISNRSIFGRRWSVVVPFMRSGVERMESGLQMRGQRLFVARRPRRTEDETEPVGPVRHLEQAFDVVSGGLSFESAPAAARPTAPALPSDRHRAAARTPNCIICYDALASTVFVGCGHRCACVACARKVGNKCPICRVESHPIVIRDA